jgi:diaminopimelate decarboxylase
MNPFTYAGGRLVCEEVPLEDLAGRYGTPLYIYSRQAIVSRCHEIEQAFGDTPHLTCYAVKANANRHILRLIADLGLGADVGSGGELALALAAGFAPNRTTFSGVGKRDDEIIAGLENIIRAFNVESEEEIRVLNDLAIQRGTVAGILLRVNLDIDAGGHAYVSTSLRRNKFGVPRERAVAILRAAQDLPHIAVRGVHSHIGSQIVRQDVFIRAAESLAALVGELRKAHVRIREIDFGGGFGIQYRGVLSHPELPAEYPETTGLSPADVIRAVLPVLAPTGCEIAIQPGRTVVGPAGALLVRVLYRKDGGDKVFVIVDGGMNDLIRPSLYQAYHQIVPVRLRGEPHETADVVGPVCESGDFFAQDRPLPRMRRGDLLAILCTGAYGFVLSSNYNARLRPAEVMVTGATANLIRERETVDRL